MQKLGFADTKFAGVQFKDRAMPNLANEQKARALEPRIADLRTRLRLFEPVISTRNCIATSRIRSICASKSPPTHSAATGSTSAKAA